MSFQASILDNIRMEEEVSSLRMKLTSFTTFLNNVAIDLEEGEDSLKVADDIHDALGDGRPNGTEEE